MPEMDMIDVVSIAKSFSTIAGWGFFRLLGLNFEKESNEWVLTAYVGAYNDKLIEFRIDDSTKEVMKYGPYEEPNNK